MTTIRRDRSRSGLWQRLAMLLSMAAAGAVTAAPLELPALQSGVSGEHHVGKVIWVELITPGLATAESFYGGLFGWTFEDTHAGLSDYAVAAANGRRIGGIVQRPIKPGEHKQSSWLTFLSVKNVDAASVAIRKSGGKVLSQPTTYGGRGTQAVFSDPDGAVFAVLDSSGGDPADFLADPGEWSHDPWSGDIADGHMWGRGALDMKSQVAAEIAAACGLARSGWRPARGELLIVSVVDEETGGELGAQWITEQHPVHANGMDGSSIFVLEERVKSAPDISYTPVSATTLARLVDDGH